MLHLKLLKALNIMLIESLLLYRKLVKDIKAIGFKVNTYVSCVANNMIRDKQMTVTWHVDELKVSHADKDIVDALLQYNKKTYEEIKT